MRILILLLPLLFVAEVEGQLRRYRIQQPITRTQQPTARIQQPRPQQPRPQQPVQSADLGGITEEGIKEVVRLGDTVQEIGVGPQINATAIFAAVAAPPVDDSHKWYITVIVSPNCQYCSRLLYDIEHDPNLRAFIDSDHTKSWSHYNVYRSDDPTQKWRWDKIKVESYPTIIIQPPFNQTYGNPSTVVMQESGYAGDPKKLATKIRDAIKQYVSTVKSGYQSEATIQQSEATIQQSEATIGAETVRQPPAAAGREPPVILPNIPITPVGPPTVVPDQQPVTPEQQPTDQPVQLIPELLRIARILMGLIAIITLIVSILSSGSWTNIFLILILIILFLMLKRKQPPTVNQLTVNQPTSSEPTKKIILK